MQAFYKLVTDMNPFLISDERVNIKMVEKVLDCFDQKIDKKNTIDYDWLLQEVCQTIDLPKKLIEPFLEMYATGHFVISDHQFVRSCSSCGKTHSLTNLSQCRFLDSMVIKTAIGIVLLDGSENKTTLNN